MDIPAKETNGIRWLKDPVSDIIDATGPFEACEIECGTIQCKVLCSGGFCFRNTDPPG